MPDQLRIVDVVDILAVAAFVYGALVWFRQARSRFVLIGVAVLGGVYFAAKTLGMRLTLVLFQAGIAVALVAVVVIFQEELRRAFERLATAGPLSRRRETTGTAKLVDEVVTCVVSLAKRKVGALLVFKGREPLDRHLTGGTDLDGALSFPLLDSIFDTSSSGHDGAVIVVGGRVRSFGVHLPLSTRGEGRRAFGTRHTAALGLSERSDALILVVSEERGEISVASNGAIEVVSDPAELTRHLGEFFERLAPETSQGLLRRVFVRNLGAKALSLAVATATWAVLFGDQGETVARTFTVPIAVHHVPTGFMLDEPQPAQATVTLSGPELSFRSLDASGLALSVSADDLRPGLQEVPIDASALDLPAGLAVHRIAPQKVSLRAQEAVTIDVDVRPLSKGRLPPPLRLEGLTASPAKVSLIVPKARQNTVRSVQTEPVELGEIDGATTVVRRLVLPPGCRFGDAQGGTVAVTVEVSGGPSASGKAR